MEKKYIIFRPNGRLANALFRYFACAIMAVKTGFEFILEEDSKEEDYIFYHGLDQMDNDIAYMSTDNINLLKHSANLRSDISGFNTLGYFKSYIDINKLESNSYINKDTKHGLYVKNVLNINDNNFSDYIDYIDYIEKNDVSIKTNIIMDGYFQFDNILNKYKDDVLTYIEKNKNNHYIKTCTYNQILSNNHKKFLINDIIDDSNLDISKFYDIAIHIRLGDFVDKDDFIKFEYLEKLFETINFTDKNIAIIIEKPENEHDINYLKSCLEWFVKRNIEINLETNDLLTDFHIMKNAKVLICCMSTLSWCAAYLSKEIETCYMPKYNFEGTGRKTSFKKPIENTIFYVGVGNPE